MVERTDTTEALFISECLTSRRTAHGTSVLALQSRPQQQQGDLRGTNKCTTASEQGQGPLRTLVNINIRLGPGTTADPGQYQH
jgi:hypothetical protein